MRAALAWLAGLACLVASLSAHSQPTSATLDLRNWDFEQRGITLLDGTWEFVPHRLLAPTDPWPADALRVWLPGEWNQAVGGRHGVGTYRVQVACNAQQSLALHLPFEHSAARYYVNGQLFAQQGVPAASIDSYQPSVAQQIVPLPAGACPFTVLVQAANHDLFRGGMVRSIQVGTPTQLAQRRAGTLVLGQTATGAQGA